MSKKKKELNLSSQRRSGEYQCFIKSYLFYVEICKKCEGKEENFYFVWKKVSQDVRDCPNNAEKKGKLCCDN